MVVEGRKPPHSTILLSLLTDFECSHQLPQNSLFFHPCCDRLKPQTKIKPIVLLLVTQSLKDVISKSGLLDSTRYTYTHKGNTELERDWQRQRQGDRELIFKKGKERKCIEDMLTKKEGTKILRSLFQSNVPL